MNNFEYASPTTKEVAVRLLGEKSAVLAGGTDLISLMKDHVVSPHRVVSLKEIRDLQGIEFDPVKGLRIGALVTRTELLENEHIQADYPGLAHAAAGLRSPQIRNMGTVGGSLCQRPHCWYYRNGFGILAIRNGKSMVREGDNRYHAILGNSGAACFVSPSTLAPPLIALGARVRIFGSQGEREIALEEFYQIPPSESEKEYRLADAEIITDILVPTAAGKRNATYEVRQKDAVDWPLVTASVALEMSGEKVSSGRVVLGQVAPVPWVSPEAAQALLGKSITEESADAAGREAVKQAVPLSRNGYKIRLARVAVKRAVLRAAGREV